MEFLAESLPSLLGAVSSAVPLMQSQRHHEKEMEAALELHRQAISQAQQHHEAEMSQSRDFFREELRTELQHHLEDIRLTIEAARRENLRDVWAQKSRRAETLLIMISLMIGGFFSFITEGIPPLDVWPVLLTCYSTSLACSFCFLFLSLFLTMRSQSRMSDFNIYKPSQRYTCGKIHESFESYYDCHCQRSANWAMYLFYSGALSLLAAACFLQVARWFLTYQNSPAALMYAGLTCMTLVLIVVVGFVVPTKTRAENTPSEAESAERDAQRMDEGKLGERRNGSGPVRRRHTRGSRNSETLPMAKARDAPHAERPPSLDQDATLFKKYVDELRRGRKGTVFEGTAGFSTSEGGDTLVGHLSPQTRRKVMMQSSDDLVPMAATQDATLPEPSRVGPNDLEEVVQEL